LKLTIKTNPLAAARLVDIVKAFGKSRLVINNVKPTTKLQKEILDDLMVGFIRTLEDIKKELKNEY
jgi:hypothetical protein